MGVLNKSKPNEELVERKACTKEDIEAKDTVLLKGIKKIDTFIDEDIEKTRIV